MARPLRQQLLVVAAALILAVLAALFYASRLTHDEQVSQLQDEALAMTSTVVAYLERTLESADDVAAVASRHPLVQRLGPQAATEVLEPLLGRADQVLRNAVIADLTGRPVAWATPPSPMIEGQVSTAWLASVASSGTPSISSVLGGPDHDAHVVLMAYPVADSNQKTVGVLALAVHLEALEKVFANIPLPRDSVITVTDEQSIVVARSLDSARYVGRSTEGATGSPRPLRSIPRTDIRTGVDGVERVYGNAVVARGPWLASVGIPMLEASERTAPIDSRNSIIMLGSLLFILGLSLLVSNGWVAALQEVGRTAERVDHPCLLIRLLGREREIFALNRAAVRGQRIDHDAALVVNEQPQWLVGGERRHRDGFVDRDLHFGAPHVHFHLAARVLDRHGAARADDAGRAGHAGELDFVVVLVDLDVSACLLDGGRSVPGVDRHRAAHAT